MKRTYGAYFSSNSKKMNEDQEKEMMEQISVIPEVQSVKIENEGQIITVEANDEDFPEIMNSVVNMYKKYDATSDVKYEFDYNKD